MPQPRPRLTVAADTSAASTEVERAPASIRFDGDARPLAQRIADLEGLGESLVAEAKAQRAPGGVSSDVAWGLKRLERWRANDERPVRVLVMSGGRLLASIDESRVDGAVVRTLKVGGAR